MPLKALLGIAGQTDIVPVRVAETLKGIDEALFHVPQRCNETANDEVLGSVRLRGCAAMARQPSCGLPSRSSRYGIWLAWAKVGGPDHSQLEPNRVLATGDRRAQMKPRKSGFDEEYCAVVGRPRAVRLWEAASGKCDNARPCVRTSHSRLFDRSRVLKHWLLAAVPLSRPGFRPCHFPFTRCFNSSNQCSTRTMLTAVAFGSPAALALSIRNRCPSADTS